MRPTWGVRPFRDDDCAPGSCDLRRGDRDRERHLRDRGAGVRALGRNASTGASICCHSRWGDRRLGRCLLRFRPLCVRGRIGAQRVRCRTRTWPGSRSAACSKPSPRTPTPATSGRSRAGSSPKMLRASNCIGGADSGWSVPASGWDNSTGRGATWSSLSARSQAMTAASATRSIVAPARVKGCCRTGRPTPAGGEGADALAAVYKALGDPTRIQILHILGHGERARLRLRLHRRVQPRTADDQPPPRHLAGGRHRHQLQAWHLGLLPARPGDGIRAGARGG